MVKAARFVNLVLAGLLAGNEFGTKVAVHPALERLGPPERVRAEQEVTRRYAAIMPSRCPRLSSRACRCWRSRARRAPSCPL